VYTFDPHYVRGKIFPTYNGIKVNGLIWLPI